MRHLIQYCTIFFFAFFAVQALNAQKIDVQWFDASLNYAPGSSVSVIINPTDTFSLNNAFFLELSDASGSWGSPVVLKSVNEFYVPVMNGILPLSTLPGRYKLRVRSTNPVWTDETPSFNVVAGVAPQLPVFRSTLGVSSTYFNCQSSNVGFTMFGSLTQPNNSTTNVMGQSQRMVYVDETNYVKADTYDVLLIDVLTKNQRVLTHADKTIYLPADLGLGTYVLQVAHTNTVSTVSSCVFLFHGNGTNLSNASSEEICVKNAVSFGVDMTQSGLGRNYKGSKYSINFGDGSTVQQYTQQQLMEDPNLEHTFNRPSCSETGSAFNVQIQLLNKGLSGSCDAFVKNGNGTEKSVNVSLPPTADFKAPLSSCVNKSLFLENTTIPGFYGTMGCKDGSNFYWYYKAPGDAEFTSVTDKSWINAKNSLTVPASLLTTAGCWTFKVEAQNQDLCQTLTTNEKVVVIEGLVASSFTASSDSICVSNSVNFSIDPSILPTTCSKPVFTWVVTPELPANSNGYVISAGATAADIQFTKPGVYLVKLKVVNACSTVVSEAQKVYVAGGAGVKFTKSNHSVCVAENTNFVLDLASTDIKPIYNVNFGKIGGFSWIVSGAGVTAADYRFVNNTTVNSEFPVIEFAAGKVYQLKVAVQSECALGAADSMFLDVNEIPELQLATTSQTICSATSISEIVLADSLDKGSFNWSITKPASLITNMANGKGIQIPAAVITNISDTVAVLNITITPTSGICSGSEISYQIAVLPNPAVADVPNKTVCHNALTSIVFNPLINTANQVVKWTASNTAIGLLESGTGDIRFTAQNTSNTIAQSTISYTIETALNGVVCSSEVKTCVITVLPEPQFNTLNNRLLCAGEKQAETSFTTQNTAVSQRYVWTVSGDSIGLPTSGEGNLPAFTALNNTNRVLQAVVSVVATLQSDSAVCSAALSEFTITVNPTATARFTGETSLCLGSIDTHIKIVAQNGRAPYRISYSLNGGEAMQVSTTVGNDTIAIDVPTNKPAKLNYRILSVQDADAVSCDGLNTDSIQVEIADNPMITTQPIASQQVCLGGQIEPLKVVNAGGAGVLKVQWYTNSVAENYGGQKIDGADSLSFTPAAFLSVGNYYYYCTITMNGSNCGSATSEIARVEVVADPVIEAYQNLSQTTCLNSPFQALGLKANGGSGSFNYQWFVSNDTTQAWVKLEGATSEMYEPSSDAVGNRYFYCEVSQTGIGCAVVSHFYQANVLETPQLTTQPLSQLICKNDTATVLSVSYSGANEKVSYQWFANSLQTLEGAQAIAAATNNTYKPQSTVAGKMYYYCLLSFETSGCATLTSNMAEINVIQYPVISDKSIQVVSNKSFQFAPDALLDTIPAETAYTWTVVNTNAALTGAANQAVAQSEITGLIGSTSDSVQVIDYLITPEVNGCVGQSFVLRISVLPALGFVVNKQNISCFGERNGKLTARVFGGVKLSSTLPSYRIQWTGPAGFQSQELQLTGLEKGDYELQVTDSLGDMVSGKFTILEPEKLEMTVNSFVSTNCFSDSIAAIDVHVKGGTGAYVYSWTKNNTLFAATEDLSGLGKGVYQLTVSDSNSCTVVSDLFEVLERQQIVIAIENQVNNSCFGGASASVAVAVSGGTAFNTAQGYTFNWSGPAGFSSQAKNIADLVSGAYTLVVTDSVGCTASLRVELTQPAEIKTEVFITPVSCYGKNDATVTVNITGGAAPYEVLWSNYATGMYQENVAAGTYNLKITDANKCEKTIQVVVAEETQFTVIPTVRQISCNGAKDGSIQLQISTNSKVLKVKWLDGSTAGSQRNNLAPGIYKVEVSDGSPCVLTNTFVIAEPAKIELASKIDNSFACSTQNSGAITIKVVGGRAPYTYLWSTGVTTQNISGLYPGTYFVTVTDSLGCQLVESFELLRHEPIKVDLKLKSAYDNAKLCYKQVCTAQVTGGLAPYSYRWSTDTTLAAGVNVVEVFANQTISVQVTDALGCVVTVYAKTDIPQSEIITQVVDCNNQVYSFDVLTPPTVFSNLSYRWDFGDGSYSDIKTPTHNYLKEGDYKVSLKITSDQAVLSFQSTVHVEGLPQLKLDREPRFCKGDSVELIVSGAENYIWSDGTKGARKMIKHEGDYSVVGVSVNGCTSTLNFRAKHYESQNYTISTDKNVLTLNDATLKVWSEEINLSNYTWDFGDGSTDNGNYLSHTYDIDSPVTVKVKLQVTNPFGCIETAEKTVWLIMESLPNTFTPDNDGSNDRFLTGSKVQIFNSNGVVLYEGADGWDGTYKGKDVATDTYYYVVYYATPQGIVNKAGFVFLAR